MSDCCLAKVAPWIAVGVALIVGPSAHAQISFKSLAPYRGQNAQRCALEDCGSSNRHSHDTDDDGRPPPQQRESSQDAQSRRAEVARVAQERKEQERKEQKEQERIAFVQSQVTRFSTKLEVHYPASSIELVPKGGNFFHYSPADASGSFGRIIVAPLAVGIQASQIPAESMTRATSILKPVLASLSSRGNSMSDEDLSFLSNQAALAMEGAPLAVTFSGAGGVSSSEETETRGLVAQVQDIAAAQTALASATARRVHFEKELAEIQKKLTSGGVDPSVLGDQRENILGEYRTAFIREREKQTVVQDITTHTIIMVSGNNPR